MRGIINTGIKIPGNTEVRRTIMGKEGQSGQKRSDKEKKLRVKGAMGRRGGKREEGER